MDKQEWRLIRAPGFKARASKVRDRHPNEARAVFTNLNRFLKLLEQGYLPVQIKAGFVHHEKKGVVAIDQSGADGSPTEIRLDVHSRDFCVHLIEIGDKASQQADIKRSHDYVKSLRGGK